jgi:3-hydroxymyristoyl/3-hydroxydecanoyl-(acyl carrier protein) dehydratase
VGEEILELIPHRPPARLVERLVRADATAAVAELVVRDGPWLRRGALAPEALVEALAQTCALFAASSATAGSAPVAGALASVSRFTWPTRAVPGDVVTLAVRIQTTLGPLVAFEGIACVGEREVARGELRVVLR